MSINNDDSNKAFDAKTMIAIVLMVVVITAGMAIQNYFFPKPGLPAEARTQQVFNASMRSLIPTAKDLKDSAMPIARGTAIGFFTGLIPGVGTVV
ncbi:MAG: hypothetical protein V2B18_15460, partial [Pseudomonadota bacterium]